MERFEQRQRTVNVAPAIVSLQRKAEEIRLAELERMHARLGSLTPEQVAAVEALTRSLVNKFLHPPMQAIKQAAREGDSARLDALCDAWSVAREPEAAQEPVKPEQVKIDMESEAAAPAETNPATSIETHVGMRIGVRR